MLPFVVYICNMYLVCWVSKEMNGTTIDITRCLSPFPLLLLLIVIYDGVGTYDETIIMDWYVGLCLPTSRIWCRVRISVPILSPQRS